MTTLFRAFVASFLVFAITTGACYAVEIETTTVPADFRVKLLAVSRAKGLPVPQKESAVPLGEINEDHFVILGRRYEIATCITSREADQTVLHIIGKPDGQGGYSLMIMDTDPKGRVSPLALIITWSPKELVSDDVTEGFLILRP